MSRFKMITLDLDDTLWPAKPVLLRADACFYDYLKTHAPRLTERLSQEALRAERLQYLNENPELEHHISRWRRDSLVVSLQRNGYGDNSHAIAEAAFDVFWHARQQVTLFPGVVNALTALSKDHIVISLTNGNADASLMPLRHCVKHSLRAEEYGASKPLPTLFEKALLLADCRPEQALHIGDHPEHDIAGATALGMTAMQAQLLEKKREHHPAASAVLSDWRQAETLVASL